MTILKSFLKMLLSFAPWLFFLIIAQNSMFRLKLGIIGAAVLTVVMAITRLHRGVIMWVGILFFTYAIVAVILLNNMWAVHYMGALANGALAVGTWVGMAMKRPFTLEYAREHTDQSLWNNPVFLRTNYFMTAIWGAVFTINASLAWQRSIQPAMPAWGYETITYSLMVSAMFISIWYPEYLRRRRKAQAE
ncbi:MAG: hypothetical protein NTV58_19855 [Deltaproteobacteria bacterium]|nr:hypothetical protein [Deltaproteobacteria bacterium]